MYDMYHNNIMIFTGQIQFPWQHVLVLVTAPGFRFFMPGICMISYFIIPLSTSTRAQECRYLEAVTVSKSVNQSHRHKTPRERIVFSRRDIWLGESEFAGSH